MIGKKELARIHVLKKEACLSDEDYRALLDGSAGVDSAKDIDSSGQYYAVIASLEKYIIAVGKVPSSRLHHKKMTQAEVIEERAKRLMGDAFRRRLDGYLRKMNRKRLQDCSDKELRRVMGFLSSLEKAKG